MSRIITINARKHNQKIHRSWNCELIKENDEIYVFLGKFEKEITHNRLGVIRRNTVSYEYYWKNEFYSVFKFYEPEGSFRNFYCNLNQPPILSGSSLDYVDLDIDVLVWSDFSVEILDLDEYQENIKKYHYPPELQEKVSQSLKDLLEKIEARIFPFDATR